jgi:hypothetical protein
MFGKLKHTLNFTNHNLDLSAHTSVSHEIEIQ